MIGLTQVHNQLLQMFTFKVAYQAITLHLTQAATPTLEAVHAFKKSPTVLVVIYDRHGN